MATEYGAVAWIGTGVHVVVSDEIGVRKEGLYFLQWKFHCRALGHGAIERPTFEYDMLAGHAAAVDVDMLDAESAGGGVEAVGVVVDETGELGFTADTLGDEQR